MFRNNNINEHTLVQLGLWKSLMQISVNDEWFKDANLIDIDC